MKKILLVIFLVCAGFIAQSQVRGYTVLADIILETDSLFVLHGDTFRITSSSNDQILQKVAGQWVNADPSYVDSLFKSENVLFTNASNDSVSSQLAIKTYVLQSIMDSVGAGVSITDDQVAVGTGTGIEGTSGLTYDGSTLGVTGNVDVSNDIFSRNDTIYHGTARILSGTSEDKQDIYLTVSGGNVYFEVEKTGGGDIEYIFGKGSEYDLDCTTGAGVGGRARVILTEGTTASYIRNYVYVTHAGGVAVLNASTSMPTGEFAWVGMATIQSDTDVTADGALQFQSMDESFYGTDLRGQLSKMREKLRWIGAEYINDGGILQTFTITEGTPDVGVLTTTAGQVYQLHRNTWSSYNMATDGLYIANASGAGVLTKNQKITDINTIRETSDGTVIVNNDRVVFTIWGTMNSMGEQKMWLNLPTDVYANNSTALQDRFNYSVTTAPKEFQTTAFLVCKLVLRYNNTGQWINLVGGTAVQDLRGVPMGYNLGGSTSTTTQSFSDADFELYYDSDASAILTYDASAITTGTERVFKVPDHNINFDGLVLNGSDSLVNGNTVYDFVTATGVNGITDNYVAVGTGTGIEGTSGLTYDGSAFATTGTGTFGGIVTIDQNSNLGSLDIDSEATSAKVINVAATNTTGWVASITNTGEQTSQGIFEMFQSNASSTAKAFAITNSGTGEAILIDQNGNGIGLNIDNGGTSAGIVVDGSSSGYSALFNNGNVGIKTLTPSEALDIVGNQTTTGTGTFGGKIVGGDSLRIDGYTLLKDNTDITGTLDVTGTGTFGGDVTIADTKTLTIGGANSTGETLTTRGYYTKFNSTNNESRYQFFSGGSGSDAQFGIYDNTETRQIFLRSDAASTFGFGASFGGVVSGSDATADDEFVTLGQIDVSQKDASWGESYITNFRDRSLDDGATYYANQGGYEIGRIKTVGVWQQASLVMLPSAVKEDTLYSVKPFDDGKFLVTRASPATRVNADGWLEEVTNDVARIDYTDGDAVLLTEPERENLITYPISFDNAYWTKSGATIDDNTGAGYSSPSVDYPTDAFKLVESSGGTTHFIQHKFTVSDATAYTISVIAKKGERDWIFIRSAVQNKGYYFDLNNGVIGTAFGVPTSGSITPLSDGWYICSVTFTTTSVDLWYEIYTADADNSSSYSGDGSSGIYLYGAQLEEGSYPTSLTYAGTEGSAITREVDAITLGSLQTNNILGATTGTIMFEVDANGAVGANTDLFLFEDTGAGDELGLRFKSDETWQWYDHHSTELIGTASSSDATKIAISWSGTSAIISKDGVNESVILSAAFDAITDVSLGASFESAWTKIFYTSTQQLTSTELNNLTK